MHILSDILKVELAIITEDEASERDQQLGKWGMDVHEELCLDIPRCEFSKMNLVKARRCDENGSSA